MVMIAGAAIAGGAAVYGANKSAKAVKQSTAAQTTANNQAIEETRAAAAKAETLNAPWREAGLQALAQISATHGITVPGVTPAAGGGFEASPGYQYRRDEALRAVTGRASKAGMIESPSLDRGLMKTADAYAANEYSSWYNRLAAMSGTGQAAAANASGVATNTAGVIGGLLQDTGQAQAAGATTIGGIQSGVIGTLGGIASGVIQNWPQQQPTTHQTTSYKAPGTLVPKKNTSLFGASL